MSNHLKSDYHQRIIHILSLTRTEL